MSVRQVKVHGRKRWQARVTYHGLRKSAVRDSKEKARDAEAELLGELKRQAARVEQGQKAPATVRLLFEAYVADLEVRGKGTETVARAAQTAKAEQGVILLPQAKAGARPQPGRFSSSSLRPTSASGSFRTRMAGRGAATT